MTTTTTPRPQGSRTEDGPWPGAFVFVPVLFSLVALGLGATGAVPARVL